MTWNLEGSSPAPFKVNQTGGVTIRQVVVQSTNPFECALPAAANAIPAGVVRETVGNGEHTAVQRFGEAECIASAAIAIGDRVNIANTSGQIKTSAEAAGTANILGIARTAATAVGDYVTVALQMERS